MMVEVNKLAMFMLLLGSVGNNVTIAKSVARKWNRAHDKKIELDLPRISEFLLGEVLFL